MRKLLLLAFSPSAVILVFDTLFYYRPMLREGCSGICDGPIYYMLITDLVAFLCLFFSFFLIVEKNELNFNSRDWLIGRQLSIGWYVFSLLMIVFLYGFLVYQVFGVLQPSLVFENYDEFYSMSGTGTAWVFLLFNIACFLLLYDLYMGSGGVLKVGVCLFLLMAIAATGGRSIIVVLVLFIIFLHVVINNRVISLIVISSGVVLIIAVFFGNAVLRSGGVDAYSDEATKLDFDNAFILSDVKDYVDINGPAYFVSIDDFYYFFVPRLMVENKPLSTAETRLIYPDVAERGTNYTFGLYGNLYLNLGYPGLALAPVLIFILNFVYFRMSLSRVRSSTSFLMLFLTFYSIQFFRGGLINSRFLIFIFAILLASVIWKFLSRKQLAQYVGCSCPPGVVNNCSRFK